MQIQQSIGYNEYNKYENRMYLLIHVITLYVFLALLLTILHLCTNRSNLQSRQCLYDSHTQNLYVNKDLKQIFYLSHCYVCQNCHLKEAFGTYAINITIPRVGGNCKDLYIRVFYWTHASKVMVQTCLLMCNVPKHGFQSVKACQVKTLGICPWLLTSPLRPGDS